MEYTRSYTLLSADRLVPVTPTSNPRVELDLISFAGLDPLIISRAQNHSLYTRLVDINTLKADYGVRILIRIRSIEPSDSLIEKWKEETDGDPNEIEVLRREWQERTIKSIMEIESFTVDDTDVRLNLKLDKGQFKSLTISIVSDLPTRGDALITAFYFDPEPKVATPITVKWKDRTGRDSEIVVSRGVIVPVQPVSISFEGAQVIRLLA
jgi:hypothetical protein